MFLFISTQSPVTSAISVLVFLGTCAVNIPLRVSIFGSQPLHPLEKLYIVLCSVTLLMFTAILWSSARVRQQGADGPGAGTEPALNADALRALIHKLPLEQWHSSTSIGELGVRALRERSRC